ncbi:MAG: carbohydrate binding domain-containing protein [Candidatus Omnitrophica bacterium]|nr:carbohydrate binding domain-containing protein [Candidatus Omnitrophota bacterium]
MDISDNPVGWKRFTEDHLSVDDSPIEQHGKDSYSVVSSDSHSGKHSILIDIPDGYKGIGGWSTRVGMKPKTTYVMTFWAKAQGKPKNAGVKVEEYGADGERKNIQFPVEKYSDEWKEYRFEFETKEGNKGALVTAYIWESSGKFWVDDLSLKEFSFTGSQEDNTELKKGETPYLHLTSDVVTPHISWALPWAGGRLKILAIPPHREVVELAQRLDMDFLTWQKNIEGLSYGAKDVMDRLYYNPPDRGLVYFASTFFQKIEQPLDVIMVGKYDLSMMAEVLKDALLKKVADGTGLVVIRPINIEWLAPAMQSVLPIPKFVLAEVSFEALPALGGESKGDNWLKCYSYGKGRVAVVNYYNEDLKFFKVEQKYFSGKNLPFTPETSYDPGSKPLYYDYYHGWLAKLVLWAGQKESNLSISKFSAMEREVSVILKSPVDIKNTSVEIAIRDIDGMIEYKEARPLQITQGETSFTRQIPPLKSGRHFVDLWLRDAQGKVLNWGSTSFDTTSEVNILSVTTDRFSYGPGEQVEGMVTTDQTLTPDMKISIQLQDSLGRLLDEKKVNGSNQNSVSFSFSLKGTIAIVHNIAVDLPDENGKAISHGRCEFVVKKEFNPSDEFRFYSWGGKEGNNFIETYMLEDMYNRGIDAAYLYSTLFESPPDQFREMLLNAARHNLTAMVFTSGQISNGMAGSKNLTDTVRGRPLRGEKFREGLYNELFMKGTVGHDFPIVAYSLGDEIAVSVLGQDFDFSPSGLVFIRQYLKSQYGDIGKLNTEWGKDYNSWDQVIPMTLKEARNYGKFAPWIDLRLAMEAMWADTFRFATNAIGKGDPNPRVGAEGMHSMLTANGEDSFNGYDFGQVIPQGKIWGCYFHNQFYPQIEFLRSFAAPGSVLWTFTNPFEDAPGGYFKDYYHAQKTDRYVPWFGLFNGMNGTTFWASRNTDWWGWYSTDMRITPWGENITSTIHEIKGGIGKMLLECRRENNGIAIHYSPVNNHVETILEGKERKESSRAFCTLLEDMGLQYDYVSKEQMADGKLSNYKFLILPYSRAIWEGEAKAMREFVAKGGVIFADGPAGIMNEHGTEAAINMLSGITVATASNPLWKYLSVRDTNAGLAYRKEVRAVLANAGIEPRFRITPKDQGKLNGCEVVEFKNGKATYLGILQGREYIQDKDEDAGRPVTITLPETFHVYSVLEKNYLGYTKNIDTTIESAVPKLYALLPCKVQTLVLEKIKKDYIPGTEIKYSIRTITSPGVIIPQVVRVDVFTPEGRTYKEYCQNLSLPEGIGEGSFTLALNDPSGEWKIVVTDVATKITTEGSFYVTKRGN